ncbi:hypothetical protein BPC006_I0546 [Burkholderia pseudomallei BPC006]|nr:hypothetical protein BPC006_I0546 [Burkholderia pseudomallei BPC006]
MADATRKKAPRGRRDDSARSERSKPAKSALAAVGLRGAHARSSVCDAIARACRRLARRCA